MADKKITQLPPAAAVVATDLIPIVKDPSGAAITEKATVSQVRSLLTQVYTGAAPPAAPDDPSRAALFYPTGGGSLLQWNGAAWV